MESFDIKAKAREEAKAKADEKFEVDFEDGYTQASCNRPPILLQVHVFCAVLVDEHRRRVVPKSLLHVFKNTSLTV